MNTNNFVIYKTVYYDKISQTYSTILITDTIPAGPIKSITKPVNITAISSSKINRQICTYAIKNPDNSSFYTIDELPQLITYLLDNNYKILDNCKINVDINIYRDKQPLLFFYI